MNVTRRVWAGPSARQTPPRGRVRAMPRIVLAAIAIGAIGLEGCQSIQSINPFRGGCCGGSGGGGLFRRNRGIYGSEPPIYTDPGVEIMPGAPIIQDEPIGGIIGSEPAFSSPPVISPPAGSSLDDALDLNPLPEPAASRNSGGTLNSRADSSQKLGARSNGREADPSYRFGGASLYGDPYADRMARRSEATSSGAARDVTPPPAPAAEQPKADEPRPMESFPTPLAILPPATDQSLPPLAIAPNPSPPAASPSTSSSPAAPPPEPTPAVDSASITPTPAATTTPGNAPGVGPSFFSVDPQLAGGAIPAGEGWATLAEHGYRTVLDLRPIPQVRPEDYAASARHGLRQIPLPMEPGRVDDAIVERFEQEIAQESARPILFADADGSGAAALWYVHRVDVEGYDADRARRDAERIAPIPPQLLASADAFLDARQGNLGAMISIDEFAPISTAEHRPDPASEGPTPDDPEPALEPAADASAPPTVAEVLDDPFARPTSGDPKQWGPYAAFFLTVLVVPLAYWSTATIPNALRTRARASLSAPLRRSRSLPAGSDAGT